MAAATRKTPKYAQLADRIAGQIADGILQPNELLPGESTLAAEAGVSRYVVRQAIERLERDGLVQRRMGLATRVVERGPIRTISVDRYRLEDAKIQAGERPTSSAFTRDHGIAWEDLRLDLTIGREVATPKDRELLQLAALRAGKRHVWRRRFVKWAGRVPVEMQNSALPLWVVDLAPGLIERDNQPYPGGTQWELADAGLRPDRVTHRTISRIPTEQEKRDLRITGQVPVLDTERVFWHRGKAIEASRVVVAAPTHEIVYEITLA
jgi:GntR family transcriptional regulator